MPTKKTSLGKPASTASVQIAVCAEPADNPALLRIAAQLAAELGLPLAPSAQQPGAELLLVATPGRLELRVVSGDMAVSGGRPLWVDVESLDTESGAGRALNQPITKAIGLRSKKDLPITVIDATAGWGKDTWLIASLGCDVLAVERSPIVAALLRDGLTRAGARQTAVEERVQLLIADSRHLLQQIAQLRQPGSPQLLPEGARRFLQPDVVYLDPMFTGSETRTTAEKKPMRVLRRLVGADKDATELFTWAMRVAGKRVVVKRPAKGGADFWVKPVGTHEGKGFRFDVYGAGVNKKGQV